MALFVCQDFCPGNIPVRDILANITPIQSVTEILDRKSSLLLIAYTADSSIKTSDIEG
jgi:hypothetical protein